MQLKLEKHLQLPQLLQPHLLLQLQHLLLVLLLVKKAQLKNHLLLQMHLAQIQEKQQKLAQEQLQAVKALLIAQIHLLNRQNNNQPQVVQHNQHSQPLPIQSKTI